MTTQVWKGGRSHPKPKLGYPKKGFFNPVKMIRNWGGREVGPGLSRVLFFSSILRTLAMTLGQPHRLPTPPVPYLLQLILEPASSSMTLHLYRSSCVILHERTVHGALRRYKVFINSIIFFPHFLNDTANLLLQWLTSFSSSSILPPLPYAFIYIQDPASFLTSYSLYAYI